MSPTGTLWGDARQRQTKVILSVAALNELELELPLSQFSAMEKPAEFLARFPYGRIPTFEDPQGWKLSEGTSIARYLSDIGKKVDLLGSNPKEVAVVDQWVHFAEHEIGLPAQCATGLVYGFFGPFNREALNKCNERLVRALDHLESYLATRPSGYVALDRVTLADFILAGLTLTCARVSLGTAERAKYPSIFAHYAKVTGDEKVKQYWGTEGFVDAPITEAQTLYV